MCITLSDKSDDNSYLNVTDTEAYEEPNKTFKLFANAVINLKLIVVILTTPLDYQTLNGILKLILPFVPDAGKGKHLRKCQKSKYCKKVVVSCKSMRKLIWLNSCNSCSEMFRKIATLKFIGEHAR